MPIECQLIVEWSYALLKPSKKTHKFYFITCWPLNQTHLFRNRGVNWNRCLSLLKAMNLHKMNLTPHQFVKPEIRILTLCISISIVWKLTFCTLFLVSNSSWNTSVCDLMILTIEKKNGIVNMYSCVNGLIYQQLIN